MAKTSYLNFEAISQRKQLLSKRNKINRYDQNFMNINFDIINNQILINSTHLKIYIINIYIKEEVNEKFNFVNPNQGCIFNKYL